MRGLKVLSKNKKKKKRGGGGKKSKRSGDERKQKVKDILFSARAQTLKAVIWHQEQKLVQCSTCKQRFGSLDSFWLDSDLKMA